MARYFSEEDIEEFRQCFYLFCKSSYLTRPSELSTVMRSLGLSPTQEELQRYLGKHRNKLSFADFLDVMHEHKERLPDDLMDAFRFLDTDNKGVVGAAHLAAILTNWGEKLTRKEVEQMFREHQIASNGKVRYEQFAKTICGQIQTNKL